MKILHVITRLVRGGAQRNTLMCCQDQSRRGHTVWLVAGPEEGSEGSLWDEVYSQSEYRYVRLNSLLREVAPLSDARALLALVKLLRRERFDVLHTHTSKAGLLGRLAALFARVPVVIHTPHGHVFHSYFSAPKQALFKFLERAAAKLCDKMVVLSTGELEDHIRYGITRREHMTIIPSGVDLQPFQSHAPVDPRIRDLPHPRVGTVARLVEIKGILELLEAFPAIVQELPEAQLILAGDGPLRSRVEQIIQEQGLQHNVTLLGEVTDVPAVLSGLDLFVLPTHNEGMGRVIVEAMAAGLPVVASAVGGVPDLVLPGSTGLLVPPRDAASLRDAMLSLLRSPEKRELMGQRGREHAGHFSDQVMFTRLEQLCQELMVQKKGSA